MNQRIMLLGANGLLGKVFAAELKRRGSDNVCLDRTACDVKNSGQLDHVFELFAPAIVINCTAYTKVDLAETESDQAFAINATGVANLAKVCRDYRAKLIHFSTDFVFDGTASKPYQPADKTNALCVYGQSKLHGETLLREIDPPGWLILRTSWLFGITGPCFPKTILDRAMKGQPLKIVNDQTGSPTYAPDLAAATLDLIDKNANGIHHLTNSGQCNWFEFAKAIVAEFGIKADIQPTTTAAFREARPGQAVRPEYSVMRDDRLSDLLGRAMPSWHETLAAYRRVWIAADGSRSSK
jgi:dTDP-4-dehydrorhamnose reductase